MEPLRYHEQFRNPKQGTQYGTMSTTPETRGQIVVRGARTHNLKNVDLTLPTRSLIVMTGVSGSGKSSLAFDTIYAEGQRRYVESLSAYARQFLERMEKPDIDSIEGICPAIAIRQKNSIRNPRSTVGTTTEIHDYLRLLYARVGHTYCRSCGREVIRETAEVVARRLGELGEGTRILIGFDMPIVTSTALAPVSEADEEEPASPEGAEEEGAVAAAGPPGSGRSGGRDARRAPPEGFRTSVRRWPDGVARGCRPRDPQGSAAAPGDRRSPEDRRRPSRAADRLDRDRLRRGRRGGLRDRAGRRRGRVRRPCIASASGSNAGQCNIPYEVPQPRLFSFNNPFGACPLCHGFGNIIELDMGLVVPDPSKSIQQNAIEPWSKPHYRSQLAELKRAARGRVRLDVPWVDLSDDEKRFVIEGDGASFEGVKGFFRWLERKKYKVHVRVFLSRYRGYLTCPECGGARLRREARDVKVGGRTIDVVCAETVRDVDGFFAGLAAVGEGRRDRRQGAAGDQQAAGVSARRRPRLPDARSAVLDPVGRRVAADQPGDVARVGAGRHLVCPGRAVDRPALTRQRTADRDPPQAAGSGQHRAGRRARCRHDPGRRHGRRHGPRAPASRGDAWCSRGRSRRCSWSPDR